MKIKTGRVARAIIQLVFLSTLALVVFVINDFLISNAERLNHRSAAVVRDVNQEVAVGKSEIGTPRRKKLPSFDQGGVIVWLHVPKTGGTTIRRSFEKRKDVQYLFSNRRPRYEAAIKQVNQWVQNGTQINHQHIKILEVHARNNPSLLEMCDQLHQWRNTARHNNVPFFAFTMLREPLSFSISYFNYYHGIPHEKRRFEHIPAEHMNEENYQRTMHFNPQCLFLARGEQAYQRNFPEKRFNLTRTECHQAHECLRDNMDWIGTTDRLQNETIPLVEQLIGPALSAQNDDVPVRHDNTGPSLFRIDNISSTSMEFVKNMTEWDNLLYQQIVESYKFEDFGLSD